VSYLGESLLDSAGGVIFFAAVGGALLAMAMLSYLYDARTCGLFASLPLRRETAYRSAVLTGLAPLLVCDGLVSLVLLLMFRGRGLEARYVLEWLGAAVFSNIGFYGFACFCGTLTGSVFILPAVYGVLLFAVPLAEAAVRALFRALLYGYSFTDPRSEWLSPPVWLVNHMEVKTLADLDAETGKIGAYTLTGLGYLAAFAAAGLLLALLGTLILKRRHMEAAGEVVAVPVLRPIFRVCMALGFGLVGAVTFLEIFGYNLHGAAKLVLLLILLCVFAALGFFVAEMLIKKTLRVFDHGWKQLGVLCALLVAFAVLTELDVTGYETRVPDASEIESVDVFNRFPGDGAREPETIAAFLDFHRGVIAHKAENEASVVPYRESFALRYQLKNGKTFTRVYQIPNDAAHRNDPGSDISAWQRLMNLHEIRMMRVQADRPPTADTIADAWIEVYTTDNKGYRGAEIIRLTNAQALSLYYDAILPDAEAGRIGSYTAWYDEDTETGRTNLEFTVNLLPEDGRRNARYLDVPVLKTSEKTLQWLEENLGVKPEV
jgi:ABC-2 type transport system permease protein